ncbi:MAG TPA: hypothetical protein PLB51_00530 [Candidatus Paceibacterota bacterium]|nr:hypothetical protein [Candidatus Paceibacterota bacterium]
MAKKRIINTRFWVDEYISRLDPIEKLLFLYFLTNPSTEICGIYEIPLKTVATDTGIDKDMVEKIIKRFSKDNKIYYKKGWIAIKNFTKHQTLNPSVKTGIGICVSKAPKFMLKKVNLPPDCVHSPGNITHVNPNPNPKNKSKMDTDTKRHLILRKEIDEIVNQKRTIP